jgi:outer membrane protein assembly factor BamB
MRLLALLLLLLASLAAVAETITKQTSAFATGDDWPTYLHDSQRSSVSSDTTISTSNAGQLVKKWTFNTGGVIGTSSIVVAGTVYVGSWDGYEYALDAATGTLKWKTYLGQTTAACYPQLAGVTSTATVLNGVVYVGGGDSNWYALDATTGNVLWKVFTGDNTKGYYNWSSPSIYNGYAYIGIASLGDCPLVPGQLLQVDLNTHQIVNTLNIVPAGQHGGGIWGSPAIDTATNTIYVTTGTESNTSQAFAQAILAIDASTLTVKSSWKLPEGQAVTDSDFGTTPTFFNDASGNPLMVSINKNGYAYAFNRAKLAAGPVWTQQIAIGGACPTCGDGSVSPGTFGNGKLYLAGGQTTINGAGYLGSVRALDPSTGNILWQHGTPGTVLGALVYDNGLVIVAGGPLLEVLDAATGVRLYSYALSNVVFSAPTVANGQIFVGDVNGNVYAFGPSTNPPPTPTPDPNCPSGWSCQDIGNPTPAGSESVAGNTWSVQAGGSGVGGSGDQFRFIAQNVTGDTQISAQVVSQQATTGPAQAGLMVRQSSDPTSPYYAVFLTKGVGVVVQYRLTFGGNTIRDVQMATAVPPLYLEIQRVGDQFQAATSTNGTNYTLVPGSTVSVFMTTPVDEGVAVSSDNNSALSTATYSAVAVGTPGTAPVPTPPATPCPSNWSCQDVGNPALVGDQSLNGGTWTVNGSGVDIWNSSDQFHFAWQSLAANGRVSAHILSQTNTDNWAKAGVMLRQSTDPGSPYYAAFVTPGHGIVVQYRSINKLNTSQISGGTGSVPTYLEVARSGSTYTTYTSSDGTTWTPVGGSSITLNMNSPILAGLAVTSHSAGNLSTVTFDTVSVSTTVPPPPCPANWNCADIGHPALAGGQSQSGGTWTIQGAGNDIWGVADQFHFAWQSLAADGKVSAHILSQTNTSTWAKAGVMLRQSTDPGSPYYAAFVTPGHGIDVQYRTAQSTNAAQLVSLTGTVPTYLEVARSGSTYTTYTSTNGTTWTLVAGSSITMNMNGSVLAGLAVTSHNGGALSAVTFDTVSVSTTVP